MRIFLRRGEGIQAHTSASVSVPGLVFPKSRGVYPINGRLT